MRPRIALAAAVAQLLLLTAARAVTAAAAPADSLLAGALEHAARTNDSCVEDLLQLVRIPSISALPERVADVEAAAEWLRARLEAAGLQHVQVLPTSDGAQPVVYGDWLHAGPDKPVVLIYGHYDVQPVDPVDLWDAPPFEPARGGDGYLYGRGIDDDKGGLLEALHAVEAYLHSGAALPVNVKFLLEGQEEVGSPDLRSFLARHSSGLLAGIDLVLNADGGQVSASQPGVCTGLRGAMALQVDVTTAAADMHSGMKGGSIENANHALLQLLAGLWDRQGSGRVTVPGFYDDVEDMTAEERADVAAFPFDAEAEQRSLGVLGFMGESGFNTLERRWYRPTLEVVGMWGGFTGSGMKTVIPRAASAKISCRLVPNQDPDRIAELVAAHLRASAPPLANVSVSVFGFKAQPWTSPKHTPGNELAAEVLQQVFGVPPVHFREGGTIPALAHFQQLLGVPTTSFGFSLGDHIHAPNERLLEDMFHKGRIAWVRMLAAVGERLPRGSGGGSAAAKDEL